MVSNYDSKLLTDPRASMVIQQTYSHYPTTIHCF